MGSILPTIMQIIALFIIAITVFMIARRYQTHATLFLAGFALLSTAHFAQVRIEGAGVEETPYRPVCI